MELQLFVRALHTLDERGIVAAAAELEVRTASAAGEVSWWTATVEIERQLRARCERRLGAAAAHQASRAVLHAATECGMAPDDPRVSAVARAAGDIARGLVSQSSATAELLRGCSHLVAA